MRRERKTVLFSVFSAFYDFENSLCSLREKKPDRYVLTELNKFYVVSIFIKNHPQPPPAGDTLQTYQVMHRPKISLQVLF